AAVDTVDLAFEPAHPVGDGRHGLFGTSRPDVFARVVRPGTRMVEIAAAIGVTAFDRRGFVVAVLAGAVLTETDLIAGRALEVAGADGDLAIAGLVAVEHPGESRIAAIVRRRGVERFVRVGAA